MITRGRLEAILSKFDDVKLLMVGDFFIDQYLMLERSLSEVSLETDLEAYQVREVQNALGAAGSVVNNLHALGVQISVLGMRGLDANGWVMEQLMREMNINDEALLRVKDIHTPTYIKPMMREVDGSMHELNRIDIKNRQATSRDTEAQLKISLVNLISQVDGVLVTDQVQESNCGVVTEGMRDALAMIGKEFPDKPIWVDSRERSGLFSNVSLKLNYDEACRALEIGTSDRTDPESIAQRYFALNNHPILITLGETGCCYCDDISSGVVPGVRVDPPIDIVGAGDSFLAASGCSLCAGAALHEAALIGNLAASVTIKKIGTTGTASRVELIRTFEGYQEQH